MFKHSQLELKIRSFLELHDIEYVKDFKQVYFTSSVEFHKNKKPFKLTCYIDFYLVRQDCFIEVKGWNPARMASFGIQKHLIIQAVHPKKYYVIKTWKEFEQLWEDLERKERSKLHDKGLEELNKIKNKMAKIALKEWDKTRSK